MKKGELAGYLIFFIGFAIKFLHAPYHAILMMLGVVVVLITYTIASFRRTYPAHRLLSGYSATLWLLFILFTVKYYPFTNALLLVATLFSVLTLIFLIRGRAWSRQATLAGVALLAGVVLYLIPSDKRYYAFNIHYNLKVEEDYRSWDKYSWFLYQNNHLKEAQNASDKALSIVKRTQEKEWIDFIEEHNAKIKSQRWDAFGTN